MRPEPDLNGLSLSRRTFVKTLALVCLAGGPILNACNLSSGENHPPEKKMGMNKAIDHSAVSRLPRPLIDLAAPARTETATFALGWFWGPDAQFGAIKGVIRTRVGYSGGTRKNPTYHALGDHSESIQIDFDPGQLSYEALLDIFWRAHDPTSKSWSRQYRAALFFHGEEQKKAALESRDREAARLKAKIKTEILPAWEFYPAEDYHQKYYLQQDRLLMKEFHALYPSAGDLVNSTAAARVNGYLGGYGSGSALKEELDQLGLSEAGRKKLLDAVSSRRWPAARTAGKDPPAARAARCPHFAASLRPCVFASILRASLCG
jgi:peptide-methionine (S)-S-oxide reductase